MKAARFVMLGAGAVWLVVSLGALAAMYHLWWTRERARYVGKSLAVQQEWAFREAGFPVSYLQVIEKIQQSWPLDIRYQTEGDFNRLSYVKYLLIPRMPDGQGDFTVRADGDRLHFRQEGAAGTGNRAGPEVFPRKIRGLLLSLLVLTGVVFLLGHGPLSGTLTIPERYGAAVFLLMAATVLSRGLWDTAHYGFWLTSGAGILGWIVHAPHLFRQRTQALSWVMSGEKHGLLWAVFGLLLVGTVVWSMLMAVVVVPDDWDAWAMWGAKAKTLALGIGPLRDVTLFGHADYPLLWPSVWAFSGWLAGGWEEHWSRAWSSIFLLFAVWEMGMVVHRRSASLRLGLLAAALFLTMPKVPLLASWTYAEAPFWLMLACAFGNILLWQREQTTALLVKGAVFCALAASTKNEGMLFSLLCLLWIVMERPRDVARTLQAFLPPLLVLSLPWALWVRAALHLDSRHFDGFGAGFGQLAAAWAKLPSTLQAIGRLWLDVRQWNIVLPLVVLAGLGFLWRQRADRWSLLLPWGMLLAYLGITLSYTEYLWLVGTAWDRLTAQALLLLIMVVFSSDALAKSRHTGENRCPALSQLPENTGFRLSPE